MVYDGTARAAAKYYPNIGSLVLILVYISFAFVRFIVFMIADCDGGPIGAQLTALIVKYYSDESLPVRTCRHCGVVDVRPTPTAAGSTPATK